MGNALKTPEPPDTPLSQSAVPWIHEVEDGRICTQPQDSNYVEVLPLRGDLDGSGAVAVSQARVSASTQQREHGGQVALLSRIEQRGGAGLVLQVDSGAVREQQLDGCCSIAGSSLRVVVAKTADAAGGRRGAALPR